MNLLKVMISSVIPRMEPDRDAAQQGVKDSGVGLPWLFEKAPASTKPLEDSYLEEARSCDVLIVLVGDEITVPVFKELAAAQASNRAILVFVRTDSAPSATVATFLDDVDRRYQKYSSPEELRQLVREALIAYVVERVRTSRDSGGALTAVGERIRDLARRRADTRIIPSIPKLREGDLYRIVEVCEGRLLVAKHANNQSVAIPETRVISAYAEASGPNWCIEIDGRIQWIDPDETWVFMPEVPDPRDPYGYARDVARDAPAVRKLEEHLQGRGYRLLWKVEPKAKSGEGNSWDLVYDQDGRYLRRYAGPNHEVLVRVLRGEG